MDVSLPWRYLHQLSRKLKKVGGLVFSKKKEAWEPPRSACFSHALYFRYQFIFQHYLN